MRRSLAAALAALSVAGLAGCGNSGDHTAPSVSATRSAQSLSAPTQTGESGTSVPGQASSGKSGNARAGSAATEHGNADGAPNVGQSGASGSNGASGSRGSSASTQRGGAANTGAAPNVNAAPGQSGSGAGQSGSSASAQRGQSGNAGSSGSASNQRGGSNAGTNRTPGVEYTPGTNGRRANPGDPARSTYTPKPNIAPITPSSKRGEGSVTGISIPSIGVTRSVNTLRAGGGELSPAPGTVSRVSGYGRVNPGDKGISVMLGHVTYYGPDVFYRLSALKPGAKVTMRYANGGTRSFVVTSKFSENKNALQRDQRVWGSSSTPVVALVTCDVRSGWVSAQHHANNYVVLLKPA